MAQTPRVTPIFLLVFLFAELGYAAARPYSWAYVDARYEQVEPSVWLAMTPPKTIEWKYSSGFFGPEIYAEIAARYQQEFGYTQIERGIDYADFASRRGQTRGDFLRDDVYLGRQKKFGEFVVRRTIERRLDAYFRDSQNLNQVYEVKTRISEVEVEAKEGWKFKANYNLAGNYVDMKWTYPKFSLEWTSFLREGLGVEGDHRIRLNKAFEDHVSTDLYYVLKEDRLSFVYSKAISPKLRWQWQTTAYLGEDELLLDNQFQHYVGFSFDY